jgi:hypothetical protein
VLALRAQGLEERGDWQPLLHLAKTVDHHVSAILTKIGLVSSSRGALVSPAWQSLSLA